MKKLIFIFIALISMQKACLAEAKKFNFSTSPVSAAVGVPNLEFGIKVAEPLILSIEAGKSLRQSILGFAHYIGFNVSTTYFFSQEAFSDSWTLTGKIGYSQYDFSSKKKSPFSDMYSASVLGGYHWQWDNGFNIDLALGVSRTILAGNPDLNKYKRSYFDSTGKFTIGYAF